MHRQAEDGRSNGSLGKIGCSGANAQDWLDCGQCRDCFKPAFSLRPGNSAQRALAIGHFDTSGAEPLRFRFGFIGSSDNHTARPGTGYKEYDRRDMTEHAGPRDAALRQLLRPETAPAPESVPLTMAQHAMTGVLPLPLWDFERQANYFMTGGLVAVHSAGRDRNAIWDALKRREVYGTSGERIVLWFDLVNAREGSVPMGSEDNPPRGAQWRWRTPTRVAMEDTHPRRGQHFPAVIGPTV